MQCVALVVFFAFCQVLGTMCTMPDLSEAEATISLVTEGMACPMDGNAACPPTVTSSPERQVKPGEVGAHDEGPNVSGVGIGRRASCFPLQWSRSSAHSIVPLSTSSSSVLRI